MPLGTLPGAEELKFEFTNNLEIEISIIKI